MVLALAFLCCLHTTLIILWACRTLNRHYFDLSKLNAAAQTIAIVSQICTVGVLGLLSYGLQRIAADKFIRQGEFPKTPSVLDSKLLLTRTNFDRADYSRQVMLGRGLTLY
jgi:hypothetical protein